MKEFVVVYGAASLFAIAVYVSLGEAVSALVSGFAFVGVVVFVWIIADEAKSRVSAHFEAKYAKKNGTSND